MTIDPKELIHRLQLTAVKARSIAAENQTDGVASSIDSFVYGDGDLSLLTISAKMLDGDPTVMDAYNLLVLGEMQSPSLPMLYAIRWDDDLPEASAYLQENIT